MFYIKTPGHGNTFLITGPLWWESSDAQWISNTNDQQYGALVFSLILAWIAVELTVELPVIWDTMTLIWRHGNVKCCRQSAGGSHAYTLRPRQNGRHWEDDHFKLKLLYGNWYILIPISLDGVPKGTIKPALAQEMPWRQKADNLL